MPIRLPIRLPISLPSDRRLQGHAYALLAIETNLGSKKFDLMKLRNPHGQGGKEWEGAWSDGDRMWDRYPDIKAKLKPAGADDGTFWIAREDFVNEFRSISVCIRCALPAISPDLPISSPSSPRSPPPHLPDLLLTCRLLHIRLYQRRERCRARQRDVLTGVGQPCPGSCRPV